MIMASWGVAQDTIIYGHDSRYYYDGDADLPQGESEPNAGMYSYVISDDEIGDIRYLLKDYIHNGNGSDSLYGIAVCGLTWKSIATQQYGASWNYDNSWSAHDLTAWGTKVVLCKHNKQGGLDIIDSVPWIVEDPIKTMTYVNLWEHKNNPLYEFFFDSAYPFNDTICIGFSLRAQDYPLLSILSRTYNDSSKTINWYMAIGDSSNRIGAEQLWRWNPIPNSSQYYFGSASLDGYQYLCGGIIPIIAPKGAQANSGDDSTATERIKFAAALPQMRVYPNPVRDELHVDGCEVRQAELIDVMGRRVRQWGEGERMRVAGLPAGVYMLRVRTDEGVAVKRVAIE